MITFHVIGESSNSVFSGSDYFVVDLHTIFIYIVASVGTIVDLIPNQVQSITFINLFFQSTKFFRMIQRGGESPDVTDGFTRAVSFIHSPEVVLVVVKFTSVVAVGKLVGPVNYDLGWRIGSAEEHTIGSGVITEGPGKGGRSGDFDIAIGRIRIVCLFGKRKLNVFNINGELVAR